MSIRLAAILLIPFVAIPFARGDEPQRAAELTWARDVAEDFLEALRTQHSANIESLLTADYARLIHERNRYGEKAGDHLPGLIGVFTKATLSVERMSPDQDEAKFTGQLETATGIRAILLRVIKEKEGKWRVGLFSFDEEKPRAKEAAKP